MLPAYAPKLDHVLAMVAYPFDPTIVTAIPGPPFPTGLPGWPLADPAYFSYDLPGGTRTVLAAGEGLVTSGSDPQPHQWFAPLVDDGFNYSTSLFDGIEPAQGRSGTGEGGGGELKFKDPEGRLDRIVQIAGWDGRPVELWRGKRGAPFSTFQRVAILTSDGWTGLNRSTKSLKIRDRQARLYGSQLVASTYAGTGGIDGDAGAKGNLKPWSFGYVFGVEPVVFDAANLLAQWHCRPVHAVLNLFVGGNPWTNMGDYPTLAALIAAAAGWANGQFGTCNALATVRYGAVPSHPVRIEGQGDKYGGVYASTRGAIVRRIATTCGMLPMRDSDDIDTASFTVLDTVQPGECGWHWKAEISIGAALDEIMAGCAGWWDVGLDGKLAVAQLEEPALTPDLVIDAATADLAGEPTREDDLPPRAKTNIGWQRNYAPLSSSDLTGAANASTATQRLFGDESRYAPRETSGVRVLYPKAREPFIKSNYRHESHADAEAQRQQALFSKKRERWTFPSHVDAFGALRNKTVLVKNWNRYEFGAAKSLRCAGLAAGSRAITAGLSLWG